MTTVSVGHLSAERPQRNRMSAFVYRGIAVAIIIATPMTLRLLGITVTFRLCALIVTQVIVGYLMIRVRTLIVNAGKLRSANKEIMEQLLRLEPGARPDAKNAIESSKNNEKIAFFRHMTFCTLGTALLIEIVLTNTLLALR